MSRVPTEPKVYHILHMDRLASVVSEGGLCCDSSVLGRHLPGTEIGMARIKRRRLETCVLGTAPRLHVGDCVPFYFCPRSVMLYLFWKNDHPDLTYHGGQEDIVHLVFDMRKAILWAEATGRHWAFTDSNAGSSWFTDYHDLGQLENLRWDVIESNRWTGMTDGHETQAFKQAEFLVEGFFPWGQVERIGVIDARRAAVAGKILTGLPEAERIEVRREWYY